jgi:hypothetical protein
MKNNNGLYLRAGLGRKKTKLKAEKTPPPRVFSVFGGTNKREFYSLAVFALAVVPENMCHFGAGRQAVNPHS